MIIMIIMIIMTKTKKVPIHNSTIHINDTCARGSGRATLGFGGNNINAVKITMKTETSNKKWQ